MSQSQQNSTTTKQGQQDYGTGKWLYVPKHNMKALLAGANTNKN